MNARTSIRALAILVLGCTGAASVVGCATGPRQGEELTASTEQGVIYDCPDNTPGSATLSLIPNDGSNAYTCAQALLTAGCSNNAEVIYGSINGSFEYEATCPAGTMSVLGAPGGPCYGGAASGSAHASHIYLNGENTCNRSTCPCAHSTEYPPSGDEYDDFDPHGCSGCY